MKKIIIALLCMALLCCVFVSCTTYEVETETEEKTDIMPEETLAESESEKDTEDDGWDIETSESDDQQPDENETESSDLESSESDIVTEGEASEDDGTVGTPADNENDAIWDPDVEEY